MRTVNLASADEAFIRQVEAESGQTVSRCYQCGNCTAGCPMNFAYDYPVHRIMRLIQAGQKDAVLSCKSIWYCATCETCTARCPNNIAVADVMDVCRHMARREKYANALSVKGFTEVWPVRMFSASFLKTVEFFGRSWEMGTMAGFMAGAVKPFANLDIAPGVLAKRKLPLLPHSIKARREVADIFKRFREGEHEK